MTRYLYPAVFHTNDDGSITVLFPDLPGCVTEGKSLDNAMYMAQDALAQWISVAAETKTVIPSPSQMSTVVCDAGEFSTLVCSEVKDGRAVRRTVSIPKWMDDKVTESGLSLSKVLQDALADRLSAG